LTLTAPISRTSWVMGLGGVQTTFKSETETVVWVSNSQIVLVRSQVAALTGDTPANWNNSATSGSTQSGADLRIIFVQTYFAPFI